MTDTDGKRKHRLRCRTVSLYVEYVFDEQPDEVTEALERQGARVWEIDGDVDLEHFPRGGVFHPAEVFRLRFPREKPVHELLSAVAMLPSVYAVCEM